MVKIRKPGNREISIVKSRINQEFNKQKNQTKCSICGKELKNNGKSFHKSHTIPFFCLENIKALYNSNYCVLKPEYLGVKIPFFDKEYVGTNKAGVFYSICSTCDQDKFNIYENEEALLTRMSEDLINSMALKIYLNELFNSRFRSFKNTLDHSKLTDDELITAFYDNIAKIEETTVEVDIKDFQEKLNSSKRNIENGYKNYKVIYYKILDYTVPVAAQVSIPISHNINYIKLQNVSIKNPKLLQDLLVCIFPLKSKSVIVVFYEIGNNLIKQYAKQFKKLSEEEKLKEIFYLLIRYKSSNYFFSPLIKDILINEDIRRIFSIEDTAIKMDNWMLEISNFENQSWKKNMPSILTEEYSIQNLKNI